MAFFYMQDLSYIIVGLCPNEFVSPGLFYSVNFLLGHEEEFYCEGAESATGESVTDAITNDSTT